MIGNMLRRPLQPLRAPDERPGGPGREPVSFQAHVELLQSFLNRRGEIVERIQGLLNAQRRPPEYLQDSLALSRHFEDGVFGAGGLARDQLHLRGQLERAHWADGFRPRHLPGLHNGLIDPAEMMVRGFHLWQQTRWPGRNGRVRFAHTLFDLYVIRCLELLSMRLWDDGPPRSADRLAQVQALLDHLWTTAPADTPVLVRDARWLVQLAQSPATDDLGAYFEVGERIAALPPEERITIHAAGVRMTAGHLRSQIRYYTTKKGVPLDDADLVLTTRTTNALDFALLVQELVPLLDAYEHACRAGDSRLRLALADAICQGVSPDPELFLNRVELLAAYSTIEYLFVTIDRDGHAVHTPMGRRHARLLGEYESRIGRVAQALADDCSRFRPTAGACSPYGVIYGFSTDLLEHMALKTLVPGTAPPFGLEDVFTGGGADKLAWVSGWRKLPHLSPDVARLFDYPQQFAGDIFSRLERALGRRAAGTPTPAAAPAGRLVVVPGDAAPESQAVPIPELPLRYIRSSDAEVVAARRAEPCIESQLLSDRQEGRCILSYRTSGGWVAISKAVLTDVLEAGRDVRIGGLPPAAAATLALTCPGLVVLPEG